MTTPTEEYKAKSFQPRNLAFFFLLAFGLTWISGVLLGIFAPKPPTGLANPAVLLLVFVGLVGAFGPTLAAFIMTDECNGPRSAQKLKTELIRNHLAPVSRIIYTHHHWDHVYGACEFDVPVTAHILCKAILEEQAAKPWGIAYLGKEIEREPIILI